MKKTITYCDRCGRETSASANRTINYNQADTYTFRITADLCEPCYDAFMDFMKRGSE